MPDKEDDDNRTAEQKEKDFQDRMEYKEGDLILVHDPRNSPAEKTKDKGANTEA